MSHLVITVSLCDSRYLYYLIPIFYISMWTDFGGNEEMLSSLPVTWTLITWSGGKWNTSYRILTKTIIIKPGRNTYYNETLSFFNVPWPSCGITSYLKLHRTTSEKVTTAKFGWNVYQNERVPFLNVRWPHHAILFVIIKLFIVNLNAQ